MRKERQDPHLMGDNFVVEVWLTRPDQTALFQKQPGHLPVGVSARGRPTIKINPSRRYQTTDGFGFALTGGSADLISELPKTRRNALLRELFSTEDGGIGVSHLRISIGASDLSRASYSYDDLPPGKTDRQLKRFNLKAGDIQIIPLLKMILSINKDLRIIATPWSAPPWMKSNKKFIGGVLKPTYYKTYARYFAIFIQKLQASGIRIHAITPQNEPLNGANEPSMKMSASEQAKFIRKHLGPALRNAGLEDVEIFCYDHNCDRIDYPLTVLADVGARQFIKGVAWHLYAGKINALSKVAKVHSDMKVYLTEQWVSASGKFGQDLAWHVRNVLIGAIRNGSQAVLEWNLAGDPNHGPHTPGGANDCLGALTIDSDSSSIVRNVSYYIIAHVSRFVRPGSARISSNFLKSMPNVAFETPDGRVVLLVLNDSSDVRSFNIQFNGRITTATLDEGAVGTYVWRSNGDVV